VSTSARIVSGGNSFGACHPGNAGALVILVGLGRIRVPGKATDNDFADLCNSRVRQERLNAHWFLSLDDARCKIEAWQGEYDTVPHSVIGHLPPADQVQLLAVVVCPK
jgi:Integrase core domain